MSVEINSSIVYDDYFSINFCECEEPFSLKIKNIRIYEEDIPLFCINAYIVEIFKGLPIQCIPHNIDFYTGNSYIRRKNNFVEVVKSPGINENNFLYFLGNKESESVTIELNLELKNIDYCDRIFIGNERNKKYILLARGVNIVKLDLPISSCHIKDDENLTLALNYSEVEERLEFSIQKFKYYQTKTKLPSSEKNTTIILQGVMSDYINLEKTIEEYFPLFDIIIYTYPDNPKNIEILNNIKEKYPLIKIIYGSVEENLRYLEDVLGLKIEYKVYNNIFHQLTSLIKVLPHIREESRFVIKSRVDCFFSDLDEFQNEMFANEDKIVSSSMYTRGELFIKYHPSDILFGGKRENMELLFTEAFNNYKDIYTRRLFSRPEQFVHWPYINAMKGKEEDDYVSLMERLYKIFSINRHSSYSFRGNSNVVDVDVCTRDYFKYGCLM